MCGIVGYTGKQHATPFIIEGLKRLEYRGYDSAGLAVTTAATGSEPGEPDSAKARAPSAAKLHYLKRIGRVAELELAAAQQHSALPALAHCGIGHTRWATHGGVTEANAHPHLSNDHRIALVHNGVIENFHSIKTFLLGHGYTFASETDTEVLCNLIAYHYAKTPPQNAHNANDAQDARLLVAVRGALRHVEGTYGLVALCVDAPDELVAARKGSPLILGIGEGEHLVASDAAALISRTQKVVYLNDGELAHLSPTDLRLSSLNAAPLEPVVDQITWSIAQAELGDYAHFMQKEIFEQPDALENTMRGRFSEDGSTAQFGGLNLNADELRNVDRIILCACGTAWHACLVTKHLIERFARLPVEVDYASEFRYRNAPLSPTNTLCLVMSQSGETIDTLAALREAKRKGLRVLAVTNVVGSTIAREADGGIYQHAGPEIGVASTKAFTSQLLIGAMLALYLARLRTMSFTDGAAAVAALRAVPALIRKTLEQAPRIAEIATRYAQVTDMLFLGRLALFPIALEGALKLKEISYIHAEGYPAAELKHGPIALISPDCPSVFFVTRGELFSKVVSSMQEVKARGGPIIAICTEGLELPEKLADARIDIPDCHEAILPLVATIPVQLLSYEIAKQRGCDVDKPRNLAKSVTVE
ncbi:glutamine--fructose-6-phosphate aminotransferase [Cephaloticoccus capnophilus]|uniref:Glutamine--fructose-6-phosphate aminotransferase [isomerizing] n=1 Tax=Cephaloticoccus capnophilus TaxID=1548208 RepID=A0A139SSG2_9BACT|nr:glutamine--fructose-6-phosphate transaminase (isomerizing) [Cephaloticoccus capnophilus]KXU37401.1 glutamine--fructose-6-phosphate aminotransferase [Cephaloticoccus capnophilus]